MTNGTSAVEGTGRHHPEHVTTVPATGDRARGSREPRLTGRGVCLPSVAFVSKALKHGE